VADDQRPTGDSSRQPGTREPLQQTIDIRYRIIGRKRPRLVHLMRLQYSQIFGKISVLVLVVSAQNLKSLPSAGDTMGSQNSKLVT